MPIEIPPAIRAFADKLPALGPWQLEDRWEHKHIRAASCGCRCPILQVVAAVNPSLAAIYGKDEHPGTLARICGLSGKEANLVVCAADDQPDESSDPDHDFEVEAVRALLLEKCGLVEESHGG